MAFAHGSKEHWLIRVHHRLRTVAFAMLFAACAIHMLGQGYGPGAWLALAMVFFVYPQLMYVRASRHRDPVRAELDNLLVDSVLLGAVSAALGFPLWIAYSALAGALISNALNAGLPGALRAVAYFALGALATTAALGPGFSPETSWATQFACMAGLGGYIVALGNIGFKRNRQLRDVRWQLECREQELLAANEALRGKLNEISTLKNELRDQADRDPLTGLYNRRYLENTLERELARCKRDGQALSLILIDIDHFKKVNDTYGHQAGDEVLVQLGRLLGDAVRAGDVACRYGGEEFLLLLPAMPLEAAQARAEDVRTAFDDLVVEFGDFRLQATLSMGVAVYPGHGTAADELVRSADRALYQAKLNGRDRVECAAPPRRNDGPFLVRSNRATL